MASVRQDMVKRAVVFLRHPKVKDAPQEKQVAFLKDKALTTEEIDEALRKAAELSRKEASKAHAASHPPATRFQMGKTRSEVVVSRGMVYVSGQSACLERESGGAQDLDAEQQATKVLDRIKELLEEAGSSTAKVVSALVFVRDIAQDMPGVDKAWELWIDKRNPPARTILQVQAFSEGRDVRVAVQVTAHV